MIKENDRKRSLHETCEVSTNSDCFSIAEFEVQEHLAEVTQSHTSLVGILDTGKGSDQIFSEVRLAINTKAKFRKTMEQQQFDSSENGSESQIDKQTEEVGLTKNDQINTISALTLLDNGNNEKVDSVDEKEVKEVKDVSLDMIRPPIRQLRNKLLVLDLNGLLADVVFPPPKDFKADAHIARRAIFKRPFCDDFLSFCFERFEVGIWSSRMRKNVERLVDFLMGDLKQKLLFCWDASYCTATRFTTPGHRYKPLVFKELRKLWDKDEPDLPWEKGYYNESNTLLIDDSPYKALLNPPHTGIFPHSFKFDMMSDDSLGAGGDLRVYLESLALSENVQNYIEQNTFGQIAITERSEDWSFYSQVIDQARSELQNDAGIPA